MNNWKKFTAACMGAAMVGTTVFGASATVFAADTVTLDVWHQFTDPESAQTQAFEAAVEEYEKEHENIKIELHGLDTESYKTKISTEFASSASGVDVFYYWAPGKLKQLTDADKWILSKMNGLIKEVTDNMEKYELGIAVAKLNDFIWEEFCDWYIEMVKPRLYNDADETKTAAIWTLKTVLIDALKLLHPYMPFITEEIFCNIQDEEESIMISSWPVYDEANNFAAEEKAIETIKEAVRNIRNLRADMNVAPSRKALVYVVSASEDVKNIFNNSLGFFGTLAYASEVKVQADKAGIPDDAVSTVIPDAVIYIPFAELVDIDKEIERLKKEEGRLQGEIKRCNGMLNNERFTSKAPQAKIDEEKAKLVKYTQMLEQVTERLATLSK